MARLPPDRRLQVLPRLPRRPEQVRAGREGSPRPAIPDGPGDRLFRPVMARRDPRERRAGREVNGFDHQTRTRPAPRGPFLWSARAPTLHAELAITRRAPRHLSAVRCKPGTSALPAGCRGAEHT